MSPTVHLVEWYPLLDPENGARAEAIEALKKVPRRQSDVVEGLTYGIPAIMKLVPDLDLKPTPELCEAAQAYLAKSAKGLRLGKREPVAFPAEAYDVDGLAGLRWFRAHGCNCDEGIAALDAVVRTYLDSPDRQKLLTGLSDLKQVH
jgi:hypothetical protein